jgi:hypothetical protein
MPCIGIGSDNLPTGKFFIRDPCCDITASSTQTNDGYGRA